MAKFLSGRQKNIRIGISSYSENLTSLEVIGKVGIGTTDPTRTLDVNGEIRLRGGLYDVNNQSGTSGQLLVSTETGVDWQDAGSIINTSLTGIGISEEGVGIGTTFTRINFIGPGVTASANGTSVNVTVVDYVSNAGVSTSVIGGIGSITRLQVTGVSTFTNGPILVGTATSTGTASQPLQVTGGAYVSGNVGIGTTNPQSALDVRGAITIGVGTVGINSVFSTTDIQSWYYTNKSKSVTGDDTSPSAIYVGASGTAMFMVGDTGNDINQYTLSTPYDVSTAGSSIAAFSVATQETNLLGIDFNPTGTKMFISGGVAAQPGLIAGGEYVHEYSLSTAWTVSSAGYTTSFNITQDTAPQGVTFGNSGSKMYVVGSTGDAVYQYSLSTPYSIASGVTYDSISLILGTNPVLLETAPIDISFNSTGTVLWIAGSANDRIYEFRLGTAWDISTAVFYDDVYVGFNEITVTGLHVIPEQNVAYIVGSSSDTVFQYSTNTPAIEIDSSGISSVSSIVLNNETRVKDKLYVKGLAHFDNSILTQSDLTVNSSASVAGTLTGTGAITLSGSTTGTIVLGTNQTTGTLQIGGATQTGAITLGLSTASQTLGIATGITASGSTKTINIGTSGASGSTTAITIGSATTGATSSVIIPSPTNLLIGTATSTGTASQRLQVDGGAYVSGNLGIGTTNPTSKLHVVGDVRVTGVVTATTFVGALTGTATSISGGLAGNIVYQSTPNATAFLVNGTSGFVLQSNGVGNAPTWVASAPSSAVSGITIRDSNNSVVGTSGSVTQLTFGTGLSVTGTTGAAGIATITLSSNIVGTALSISGISTFTNGPVFIGTATSTGTASQRLQVDGGAYVSGNIGIGTTNPQNTLDVGVGTIRLINKSSTGRFSQIYQDNNLIFSNSSTNDDFDWTNSSGSRMRLYGTGNLVIPGTFTPTGTASQRLQVDGGAYISGSVGIGTTNPGYKLLVYGNAIKTSADGSPFAISSNDATNPFQLLIARSSSSVTKPYWSIDSVEQNVAYRNLSLLPSGGNVTIGSTLDTGTTSQVLQVNGGAYVSTRLGVGVTNPAANTQVAIAGTLGIDAVGNAGTRTLFTSSSSGFTLNHNDNSQITFQTLGVNRLTYSHSSNFWNIPAGVPFLVGTGTSTGTASQRLQVDGGAYVSGNLGVGTTNPVATLQVKDALAFETTNTTTTSTSQVAVDTFATATFRSAKYQVQMTCPGQLATLGGITTGGSGYTAGTFNVTFSNSSGTGAAAQGTLTISNGTVSQIGLGTTGGSGYTAGDVLTAGGGSGLQVSVGSTASPSGRILTLGAITSAGIGYTSGVGVGTTTLAFLGGTGTGAVGLATIFDGVITSSTLLQQPTTGTGGTTYYSGSNYTTATVLTIAKTDVTNTITDIAGSVGVSTFTSLTAHGIGVSDTVRVSSTSNGLTAGTNYFVVTTPTTTTFTLGSSVGIGTTFTTGSSLSLGFYRNSANAGGSVAYLNAITGVSTNFQVSDLMVLQNGTTADFVEYGTIANNDVLGTFAADISGANTRLLVTPTYATNTVKVARQAITV